MIALLGIVTVLLEYIDRLTPIMLALCSMLLVTYYAFNYATIIGRGLHIDTHTHTHTHTTHTHAYIHTHINTTLMHTDADTYIHTYVLDDRKNFQF